MHSQLYVRLPLYFMIFLLAAGTVSADKPQAQVQPLSTVDPIPITPDAAPVIFRTGDTCSVNPGGDPVYYIYPWVVGNDLYKAYQDPAETCSGPYPYTIEMVHLPLIYLDTGTVYLSVDIESVDYSDPSCPRPGTLLAISPYYELILENNFYMVNIPLDTPVVVNGPYFVGAYFGVEGNPEAAAMVTDTNPLPCVSYNDWGEGYVDLDTVTNDQGQKVFPGRLILYSSGTTGGGGGTQPAPAAQFINPIFNQSLGTVVDLWANDAAGSEIIERASFQFRSDGDWMDIGFDADDNPPLRNGVTGSGTGNGLAYTWNTSGIAAGDYELRAIIGDTLGRSDTVVIPVDIDPSPPRPVFSRPVTGQNVCRDATIEVTFADDDISFVSFERKSIPRNYSLSIPLISQQFGGDTDADPDDGNTVANGEYGDYCSAAAAAAMALKYWFNKGYTYLLREGGSTILTDTQLMERLFTAMVIADNLGAYDEEMIAGLRSYVLSHGAQVKLDINRRPGISDLYTWMGDYEYAVMVGLSGDPGRWLTAAGVSGMIDENGYFTFRMADPATGVVSLHDVKEEAGRLWIDYNSNWHEIDIMVGVIGYDWTVSRTAVGVDAIGNDGWSYQWNIDGLSEDSLYFVHATGSDQDGKQASASVLVQMDCSAGNVSGDVNHDGEVNPADIVFLSNYLYLGGPPPPGDINAADINCDNALNLADLIYLFNYLYQGGPAPCP